MSFIKVGLFPIMKRNSKILASGKDLTIDQLKEELKETMMYLSNNKLNDKTKDKLRKHIISINFLIKTIRLNNEQE